MTGVKRVAYSKTDRIAYANCSHSFVSIARVQYNDK